jgi:hypothetical protein
MLSGDDSSDMHSLFHKLLIHSFKNALKRSCYRKCIRILKKFPKHHIIIFNKDSIYKNYVLDCILDSLWLSRNIPYNIEDVLSKISMVEEISCISRRATSSKLTIMHLLPHISEQLFNHVVNQLQQITDVTVKYNIVNHTMGYLPPLYFATRHPHIRIKLLEHGAIINARVIDGCFRKEDVEFFIDYMISNNQLSQLKVMCENNQSSVLLHLASFGEDILKKLLDTGISIHDIPSSLLLHPSRKYSTSVLQSIFNELRKNNTIRLNHLYDIEYYDRCVANIILEYTMNIHRLDIFNFVLNQPEGKDMTIKVQRLNPNSDYRFIQLLCRHPNFKPQNWNSVLYQFCCDIKSTDGTKVILLLVDYGVDIWTEDSSKYKDPAIDVLVRMRHECLSELMHRYIVVYHKKGSEMLYGPYWRKIHSRHENPARQFLDSVLGPLYHQQKNELFTDLLIVTQPCS